jgi:S-adenosylmethionine:tRNA ribosyltransferase-isomerase
MTVLDFDLPSDLEASDPVEPRDQVRLLVAGPSGVTHARFADLPRFLEPGDLLVVNTSPTMAAAVHGERSNDRAVTVHFSTGLDDGTWVVELRPRGRAFGPVTDVRAGEQVELADAVVLTVLDAHPPGQSRLWRARIAVDGGVPRLLARHGEPIRYAYVPTPHPLAEYQTVFSREREIDHGSEPGSAEMPSAGRPFTTAIVTELVVRGIAVAPVTLHTGVSSQDAGEPPLPERYSVPPATARLVNLTRADGGRVVAVGTTVTRALESAADDQGRVSARDGWTDLVLGPRRLARVVTGLVTGWHAPGASHLHLLDAVAGSELVRHAYAEALRSRYTWHEFGDSCLLLP